jgi:hypothetical protein
LGCCCIKRWVSFWLASRYAGKKGVFIFRRVTLAALTALCLAAPAIADDPVLFQYQTWLIKDSRTGPVAQLQAGVNDALASCGIDKVIGVDGQFGRGSRSAIIALAACDAVSAKLPDDSPARTGAATVALWDAVMPGKPAPTVGQRAAALKLTFEATDYDRMQWNYCQNRPRYAPDDGLGICFSNDKRSFITWGPNGATAGHGREVQAILAKFRDSGRPGNADLFNAAFAAEAPAVQRMLELENKSDNSALETYLCGVWMSPERRSAWVDGFRALGKTAELPEFYRDVYRSASFDGGKIATFHRVWASKEFGLPITELDHAFFIDRSAHMSISERKLKEALLVLKSASGSAWPPSPAAIRQYVALNVRPPNQRTDRLGRDIAFYVEGIGQPGLSAEETAAWASRGRRNAVDIGLGDARNVPVFTAGPAISHPMPTGTLTDAEKALCPAAVLNPSSPPEKD